MNKLLCIAVTAICAYTIYKEIASRRAQKRNVKGTDQTGTIYDLTIYKMSSSVVTSAQERSYTQDIITISGNAMKKKINPKNN